MKTLNECSKLAAQGQIPLLDLELTKKCLHGSCIYCDSDISNSGDGLSIEIYKALIKSSLPYGLKWIYICGFGEPSDYEYFFDFVDFCFHSGVGVSFFTHTMNFDDADLNFLKSKNINTIMKYDSFHPEIFDFLLGKSGSANKILHNLDYMLSNRFVLQEGESNLALSIVVTQKNIRDIPEIVTFCVKNNIFPSVGQLEFAGKAKSLYSELMVNDDDLYDLKAKISNILGYDYYKPVCPSVLYGLHLDSYGNCLVDFSTGLNCSWFLLEETHYEKLGNIRENDVCLLLERVKQYRSEKYKQSVMMLEDKLDAIIGGCGGCISKICLKLKNTMGEEK
jgi:MoaA/NifB/PqqE/SkfB family radical SAM enzyme